MSRIYLAILHTITNTVADQRDGSEVSEDKEETRLDRC